MSKKPLILIADDEVGTRESLRFLLKDDYDLVFAENGIQALEQVKSQSPDLILMDISMPQLSGWKVIRKIRAQRNFVPIIVITGLPDPSDKVKVQELGVSEYLSKPFDLAHLQQLIRETILVSESINFH